MVRPDTSIRMKQMENEMDQQSGPGGRNVSRQRFLFKETTRLGESPYEKAEISTLDEMGLSELEIHVWGSCACGRTFSSPDDIKAICAITQEHLCAICAQTVCPKCLRVVSPVTGITTLFGQELCLSCAKNKIIKLVLGSILFLLLAFAVYWWCIR